MRETRERDICNSNAIFDLVPLFLSPTLVSSSVHVHPFIRLSVYPFGRVYDERRAILAWLLPSRRVASRRLSASWLWNARRRTKIRVLSSRSSNAKDDGRPAGKPDSLGPSRQLASSSIERTLSGQYPRCTFECFETTSWVSESVNTAWRKFSHGES